MNYPRMIFRILTFAALMCGDLCHSKETAPTERYADYLSLLKDCRPYSGSIGEWRKGEIEIITDPIKMSEVEQATGRKVGVIYQDKYWVWLNDAVRFPNGSYGVYGRILWTQSLKGVIGVAVMCLAADGSVVLNCNYRHATRSWELELPRGGAEPGESILETARREVLEETGMVIDSLTFLGDLAADTGVLGCVVPVVLARACSKREASPEASEAIAGIVFFNKEALFQALREGKATVAIEGKQIQAYVRDPFLTFALLQAQIRGLY